MRVRESWTKNVTVERPKPAGWWIPVTGRTRNPHDGSIVSVITREGTITEGTFMFSDCWVLVGFDKELHNDDILTWRYKG